MRRRSHAFILAPIAFENKRFMERTKKSQRCVSQWDRAVDNPQLAEATAASSSQRLRGRLARRRARSTEA